MKSGFTLLELLMVLAIVSILSGIAYPSYQHYIAHVRRIDGKTALLDLAIRMEHYYTEHETYASARIASGKPDDIIASSLSKEGWYQLSIYTQTEDGFVLHAVPRKAQAADLKCQTLTLNHLGEKGIILGPNGTPTGTTDQCW